jgi:hypothetical protein
MAQCFGRTRSGGRCKRNGSWWLFCEDHRKLRLMAGFVAGLTLFSSIASSVSWFSVSPTDIRNWLFPPHKSLLEVVQSAAAEGVKYSIPSSEMLMVKVVTRANLEADAGQEDRDFLFSLVSPFQPSSMDTIFRGDVCRFMGIGKGVSDDKSEGFISITGISCVNDRGLAYSLMAPPSGRLGFVTSIENLASEGVAVVRDNGDLTLRQSDNVLIRFDKPIVALSEDGRTRWSIH